MEIPSIRRVKLILTGATGMVGEGVLRVCLSHPQVEEVLVLSRRPTEESHPRLRELIVPDLMDLSGVAQTLKGYDGCLFCAGVTSIGKSEETYYRLTYTLTLSVAERLADLNPQMTFCYISGMGTDSSGEGKVMWARVKGKTENDLQKLPFKAVYLFRPGFLIRDKGARRTLKAYRYVGWLAPLFKLFAPQKISTLGALGRAMVGVCLYGFPRPILNVKDFREAAAPSGNSDRPGPNGAKT